MDANSTSTPSESVPVPATTTSSGPPKKKRYIPKSKGLLAKGHGVKPPPALVHHLCTLVAHGTPPVQAAESVGIALSTAYRWIGQNRSLIESLRAGVRASVLDTADTLNPELRAWLQSLVTKKIPGTAREVDALTRALHALEKASASAAGEGAAARGPAKVEVVIRLPDWASPQPVVIEAEKG